MRAAPFRFVGMPPSELFGIKRVLHVDQHNSGLIRTRRVHADVESLSRPSECGHENVVRQIDLIGARIRRSGYKLRDLGVGRISDIDHRPARNVVMPDDKVRTIARFRHRDFEGRMAIHDCVANHFHVLRSPSGGNWICMRGQRNRCTRARK